MWCLGVINWSGNRSAFGPPGPSMGGTKTGRRGWPICSSAALANSTLPERVGNPPFAHGRLSSGNGTFIQPSARRASRSTVGKLSRSTVMSSWNNDGSVSPIAPAIRRKHSLLLTASPSGSIAASFQPIHRWPQASVTSSASMWVVAGSTMSAYLAVSVRNCSWTTVNRSSRAIPARAVSALGTITSGFEFHTIIARTGGCSSSRISPSRLMFKVRTAATGEQVGARQRLPVDQFVLPRSDASEQPAAELGPGAGERRQAGQRAVEHRPVLVVLGADQGADRGRSGGGVPARQLLDHIGRHAARLGGPGGRPVGDRGGQLVEPERVLGDPRVVVQVVADDDVHHRQHHGDVGARQGLDELVAVVGGEGADRVDHDHLGAVGAGLLDRPARGDGW